jgi:hypothetical protein
MTLYAEGAAEAGSGRREPTSPPRWRRVLGRPLPGD